MQLHVKNSKLGFTVLELLIVISVMALLFSIIFASLGNARESARVTVAIKHVREIEKSLVTHRLKASSPWPNYSLVPFWTAVSASTIEQLISTGGLNNDFAGFSDQMPRSADISSNMEFSYFYRSDYVCGDPTSGVNIRIGRTSPSMSMDDALREKLFLAMEDSFDSTYSENCGRVRLTESSIYFLIARHGGELVVSVPD